MSELSVFVSSKDDEFLIVPCLKALKRYFQDITVVDLGSDDSTVLQAQKLGVKVENHPNLAREDYSALKNSYGINSKWTFWVDADEVYVDSSLKRLLEIIKTTEYTAIRTGWVTLLNSDKGIMQTPIIVNGTKIFQREFHEYYRAWPKEVLRGEDRKEPAGSLNGVWCWHGVLLNRSSVKEKTVRRKKRESKLDIYIESYEWENISSLPFEVDRRVLDCQVTSMG